MNRKFSILITSLASGLLLIAAVPAGAQSGWGTVKGKFTFSGAVTKEKAEVDKDKAHCLSKGPIFLEEWVVDPKTKGVRDVFVWLMPMEKGSTMPVHPKLKSIKKKEVFVDQPCCAFVPHAMAIREGQVLIVKNSAPVQHNIRWQGHPFAIPNGGGNVTLIPGGKIALKNFKANNKVPVLIKCDFHKWMSGHIRVFNHPYYAVTNEKGEYEIPLAPAGRYRLFIWKMGMGYYKGVAGANGFPITIPVNSAVTKSYKLKKS